MRSVRARINLFVDAVIGVALVIEAVTGWVLWQVLPHGGFQGGRNPDFGRTFIWGRDTWLGLHDVFAVVIVVGVLVHLALHWRWIACMARNLWRDVFTARTPIAPKPEDCPVS